MDESIETPASVVRSPLQAQTSISEALSPAATSRIRMQNLKFLYSDLSFFDFHNFGSDACPSFPPPPTTLLTKLRSTSSNSLVNVFATYGLICSLHKGVR